MKDPVMELVQFEQELLRQEHGSVTYLILEMTHRPTNQPIIMRVQNRKVTL